ncbi:hypothetical protein SAMN05428975_0453 [Mucilaginibacter sp. OK268]|nr:hypothetical protein SAMN05428975_0453 [Mucilaginibacter sp. OK268]
MKTFKLLLLFVCAITIMGCNKSDYSVSGVYVMSFKNEYSIATDTLVIQSYNLAAGTYQVERRDGYHRIRDGKTLPKEYRQEHWMATFDKDKQVLQETIYGRQIYIKDDGRSLSFGGIYRKID